VGHDKKSRSLLVVDGEEYARGLHAATARSLHTTSRLFDLEQKSKVEQAVEAFKQDKESLRSAGVVSGEGVKETLPVVPSKKSIWQKVVAEAKHYYHGFRLLGTEISISWGLLRKIITGDSLTRREHKQVRITLLRTQSWMKLRLFHTIVQL
jgi:LETM1 and EF-hand domain-containing protein 1, mitochondrial